MSEFASESSNTARVRSARRASASGGSCTVIALPTQLSRRMAEEDLAEDAGLLAPDDRVTCAVHGRWIHQCVSSSLHVNQVTRHRWCRGCARELTVAVDELTGDVTMACPVCGDGVSAASARLIAACRVSLTSSRRVPSPALVAA